MSARVEEESNIFTLWWYQQRVRVRACVCEFTHTAVLCIPRRLRCGVCRSCVCVSVFRVRVHLLCTRGMMYTLLHPSIYCTYVRTPHTHTRLHTHTSPHTRVCVCTRVCFLLRCSVSACVRVRVRVRLANIFWHTIGHRGMYSTLHYLDQTGN